MGAFIGQGTVLFVLGNLDDFIWCIALIRQRRLLIIMIYSDLELVQSQMEVDLDDHI